MVDIDTKRSPRLTKPAHYYALRRLSARAATYPLNPVRTGQETLTNILVHLNSVQLQPGLTEPELVRLEAELNFIIPSDLKHLLLAAGLPDWQSSAACDHLRTAMNMPAAAICMQVAREHAPLWCKSWGPRPSCPEKALKLVRKMLKKAPLLIPIMENCYLPCKPCLAGNPVFFIDENEVFCCGIDLFDFLKQVNNNSAEYSKRSLSRTTRWIELWSDVVVSHSQRKKTTTATTTLMSCSSPESVLRRTSSLSSTTTLYLSMSSCTMPNRSDIYYNIALLQARNINEHPTKNQWVEECVMRIGSVMRAGGWGESDIEEIVRVSSSRFFEEDIMVIDSEIVRDAMLLKVNNFSEVLKKGGWSCEEASDVLGLKFWCEEDKREVVNDLSPDFAEKIRRKFADSLSG